MPGSGFIATQLTTPDATRAYTVSVCSHDVTGDTKFDSLSFEDQGTSAQGTTGFRIEGKLVNFPAIIDQGLVSIFDHVSGGQAFRGFIDSRHPARAPVYDQIELIVSDHTSLLDNVIPFESRPAGESDAARIGYLWGLYAGPFLQGWLQYVQTVQASMPAQIFAGVSLRQALDLIAAQASSSAVWYLDSTGQLHYFTAETNNAPKNVTSDTPGAGEIAPTDLAIDYDSKSYIGAVYVRGKTDAGSGWVRSESAKLSKVGLVRTRFFDAPDCTTSAMRDALGNMYLGRVNTIKRGSFSTTSKSTDGWRAGQNVTVRSTHLGNVNTSFRIARVRTSVMGPYGGKPSGLRKYEVEFGGARAGVSSGSGTPVVGTGIIGDILDDNGNLLLGSGNSASTAGLGAAIRRYITSGVYNGDFALTPPYPDATIVDAYNPLPYWSFTIVAGTSTFARSIADSSSASGRVLRFDIAGGGGASDEAYVEQIVPVNGSRGQTFVYLHAATALTPTISNAFVFRVTSQYLKSDGVTTTGTASTQDTLFSAITGPVDEYSRPNNLVIPADAAYLRIRIGVARGAAAVGDVGSIDITETRLAVGGSHTLAADTSDPTKSPTEMFQTAGITWIYNQALLAGAAVKLQATAAGFIGDANNYFTINFAAGGKATFTHGAVGSDLYRPTGVPTRAASTVTLVLTTTDTDIASATLTAVANEAETWLVMGSFLFDCQVTGTGAAVGSCWLDGVAQAGVAESSYLIREVANVFQSWVLSVAAGSHTVKLRARKSINDGTVQADEPHCTITLVRYATAP